MYCLEMLQEDYWQAYEVLLDKLFLLYDTHGTAESQSHLWNSAFDFCIIYVRNYVGFYVEQR